MRRDGPGGGDVLPLNLCIIASWHDWRMADRPGTGPVESVPLFALGYASLVQWAWRRAASARSASVLLCGLTLGLLMLILDTRAAHDHTTWPQLDALTRWHCDP